MDPICPPPSQSPLWEEIRAAIGLLVEWDRESRGPEADRSRVIESGRKFAGAVEALVRRLAAGDGVTPEDRVAWEGAVIGFMTWSAANQNLLQYALIALPREALIAIQNLSHAAFLALLTQTLGTPPHRERFLRFADQCRGFVSGGTEVRPSDALGNLLFKYFEVDDKAHPVFESLAKFESYLRPRLRTEVRGRESDRRKSGWGQDVDASRQPDRARRTSLDDLAGTEDRGRDESLAASFAAWPAHLRAALILTKDLRWPFTDVAEVIDGDEVRPEAGVDEADRRRRATRRNTRARELQRELLNAINRLGLDAPPPPPED